MTHFLNLYITERDTQVILVLHIVIDIKNIENEIISNDTEILKNKLYYIYEFLLSISHSIPESFQKGQRNCY